MIGIYKFASSNELTPKDTFDSYGISIFECTNKIVSLSN